MNCEEFRAAVVSGAEDEETRLHESSCASCRAQANGLRAAFDSLAKPAVWEEPSPELGGQIEALIRSASGESAVSELRTRRPWGAVAAAVAAVLVLFVGSIALLRGSSPDWEVALPATDLAPTATGVVQGWNEESGTRMVVSIDGLDPAPSGFVYEFWLSDGPIHISAGTFHSGGEIELWSGVGRTEFPRLWITLEPLDEDESPSGNTVLDTGKQSA